MSRQASGTQVQTILQARVVDLERRQPQWRSPQLSSGTVVRNPEAATSFVDSVLAEIDSRFALIPYSELDETKLRQRADQLGVSARVTNPLSAAAEIRYLQNHEVIDSILAGVKYSRLLEIELSQGTTLAGDAAEKRKILEAWLANRP
jgi:hypothetical protein